MGRAGRRQKRLRREDFVFPDPGRLLAEWEAMSLGERAELFIERGVPMAEALAAADLGFVVTAQNRHNVSAADLALFEERTAHFRKIVEQEGKRGGED